MKDIQPHESIKVGLDTALDELHAKITVLQSNVNRDDGPMLLAVDVHDVKALLAVVEARIEAYTVEYAHVAGLHADMRKQRDDLKRRLDSLKRTFNRSVGSDPDSDGDDSPTSGRKKRRK